MDKTLDLDELERVAREATPGPWMKHDHEGPYSFDKPAEWVGYAWVGFGGESDGRFQGVVADLNRRKDASPAYRAQAAADAKHIATFDPPTILSLISAARRPEAEISVPDMPGQFDGDIWFGDPVKRNLGTHRWQDGEWTELPSEMESVLDLLAVRTAQRDAALSAARPAETRDWLEFEDEISDAISDSIDMDWSARDGARAVVALLNKDAPRTNPTETAWLIEWPATRQDVVRYWHPTEGRVIDPNHAVRFCRREDAEAMCKRDHLGAGARPVEHMWVSK